MGNALVVAWTLGMEWVSMDADPRYQGLDHDELLVPLVATGFGVIYLGLPSLFLSSRAGDARIRLITRISVLLLFVGSVFVPAILGFLFGATSWQRFEHPLNPIMVLAHLADGRAQHIPHSLEISMVAATFVLVASLPRLFAGLREVLVESRARETGGVVTPQAVGDA